MANRDPSTDRRRRGGKVQTMVAAAATGVKGWRGVKGSRANLISIKTKEAGAYRYRA